MKELETDVVVIACGISGLAALVSAAEGGARVVAFEKGSTTGGAGNMGVGPFAVESRHQRIRQMTLTKKDAFRMFMDYTHWRVDARLVKAYIDKSADTIDWLEQMGVEFVEPAAYFPGSEFTWHIIDPGGGFRSAQATAGRMVRLMTDRAKELGAQIFLQTAGKSILKEGNRVKGVIAEDRSGEPIHVAAKAAIIATGGFGDNPAMIKKYTGYEYGKDLFSFRVPGLVGDGIRMAWEAGAAPSEITMELIFGIPGEETYGFLVRASFRQPNLMVNLLGERFMNEEVVMNTPFTGNAIARQKDRCAVMIYDETILKHYVADGFDLPLSLVFSVPMGDIEGAINSAISAGIDNLVVADSLDELAEKAGIDPEGLKETVEEYNRYCDQGQDDLFNKDRRYLRPLKGPRFFGGKNYPGAYGSLGGIKINYKAEVMGKDWKKIPGLYAAGSDTCSIYGDSYPFILPGNTMGYALNSGRIAGENASAFAKSVG